MPDLPTSPRDAAALLSALAARLQDPAKRDAALTELRALADRARGEPEGAPLRLVTIEAAVGLRREKLELLLLPSIFAPEDWAFTFLEGLLKVPLDEYAQKSLVEVGTGSGWICIALAKFTRLARVTGVDLNPHAAPLATCNAWLNGGLELAQRLGFGESDLLKGLPAGSRWDFVIGCIPQVLRRDIGPVAADDERALYDLSNYTAVQNVYEDHFGLGLIAKLLDEVPEYLAPGARVLLNLAGRPGRPIIERMFSRRGFATDVLFARRVRQAGDTDIRPLVELEQRTQREFEFFLEAHSPEPLCAATALGWLGAGNHAIWHEVAVWQARPVLQRETLALRAALRALSAQELLSELDLSAASQEQLDFVTGLSRRLSQDASLPYAHEAGDAGFRAEVAQYLERFFGLALDPAEIFVAPEREQAVYSLLLSACDPGDAVLVSRNLHATCARALAKAGVRAVVANDTLAEVRQLLSAFDVKALLLAVEPGERSNVEALRGILDEAQRRGVLVVLDESASFNITSGVEARTLFEFLAREPHRPSLVVLYGLVKNAVFPDFELTLLLPVQAPLRHDLEIAAEVTYSRIGTLPQWFYERLFSELLSFRISFAQARRPSSHPPPAQPLPRSRRMRALSQAPAFASKIFDEHDPELVRLDYGENEAEMPRTLALGLVAACAASKDTAAPPLEAPIASFLLETRGVRYRAAEIVTGQGVWPLVHDLAIALRAQLGRAPRFFLATPCYGLAAPTLRAAGAEVVTAPLEQLPAQQGLDAVLISQPANPTGEYLDREALVALCAHVVEKRLLLVSDEIFGLLNLSNEAAETVPSPVSLELAVPGIAARTVVLGGLSKEFAVGGLRLGWAALRDEALAQGLRAAALGRVHQAAARAAAHLYGAYARGASGKLLAPERHRALRDYRARLQRELAGKRALLLSALPPGSAQGREVGGLFLAPRLSRFLAQEKLAPEELPRVIYQRTHVVVNGGDWCGDPERVRMVFSIPRDKLERAAARLRALFKGTTG